MELTVSASNSKAKRKIKINPFKLFKKKVPSRTAEVRESYMQSDKGY